MAETSFPRNAWYAAAWGHEVGRALSARTICAKDVVLYRKADGTVVALEDVLAPPPATVAGAAGW